MNFNFVCFVEMALYSTTLTNLFSTPNVAEDWSCGEMYTNTQGKVTCNGISILDALNMMYYAQYLRTVCDSDLLMVVQSVLTFYDA